MVMHKEIELNPENLKAFKTGVFNLLSNAVGARQGEKILIVGEHGPAAHFDEDICENVAEASPATVIWMLKCCWLMSAQVPMTFRMRSVAQCGMLTTLCFSRGSVIRFDFVPPRAKEVKRCATPLQLITWRVHFAQLPYRLSRLVHDRLVARIIAASDQFCLKCADGTNLVGELSLDLKKSTDNNSTARCRIACSRNLRFIRFPLAIFPPVSTESMSGRLVLKRWLTSSSTISYDNSVFHIPQPGHCNRRKGKHHPTRG